MKLMIHAHTTFSADGELKPTELAQVARQRGFDAVLVSDHFESLRQDTFHRLVTECEQIDDCLMIPGYERSFRGYHVLALGVDRWISDKNIQTWSDKVRIAGGITAIAHPSRYNHVIPSDILEACDAVEVWNSKFFYDGEVGPNPRAYPLLGAHRYPLCSQDLHGTRHGSPVGVRLPRMCTTGSDVIACLKEGDYQMTNGFLTYERDLSRVSTGLLDVFHRSRRHAVKSAVELRRWMKG